MPKMSYWNIMTRRKPMPCASDSEESKLGRVFSTFDLTALGVSATLGVGVYVLAGHVAKLEAGPSVILSFAIAAAASFLAGLCYAEFASRVPKSGSAYIFTYVAIGEFVAFIIGWNLLLEYIIGSASIAKGLSLYIDSLIDNTMKNYFKSIAPLNLGSFLSSYFDFFAFGGPLLLGLALAFGLRKSAGMNNILCLLNLGVVLYVVITVLINANLDYWRIDPSTVPEEYRNATGTGGFFPFGVTGTIKGAATCFFGFVGFDCIATTGEEVRNPRKAVPRAILFSLVIIFLAYFGVALLTLMWPYYLLDVDAPLPHAFQEIGWITSKWIVTIGGILGLVASLFGAMFPLPRILYAMSMDGLIFREFGIISERFQTPVIGTLCAAALTSCFAGLFDLAALVNMLSIGVLLAYTVVAISIIVLRFSHPSTPLPITNGNGANETSNLLRPGYNVTAKGFFMQLFRFNSSNRPNNISTTVICVLIACYCTVSLALALIIRYRIDSLIAGELWAIVTTSVLAVTLLIFCLLISIQPKQVFNSRTKPFMVHFVPFLPAVSVFINIYLMLMLDFYTWIRFGLWMIVGIFVYFPSTWLYNYKPIKTQNTNNIVHEENPNDVVRKIENNNERQEGSSDSVNSVIVQNTSQDQNNLKINENIDSHSAIVILDTVLESEEDEMRNQFEEEVKMRENEIIQKSSNEVDRNFQPVPAPRTSLLKEETQETENLSDEIEIEIIVINNLTNDSIENDEPVKLKLEIINPDEMVNDIRKEIDQILFEAQEEVNAYNEELTSPEQKAIDENIFQNRNFLTHLSDVITKSPLKTSQTLSRTKSKEKSESFKRSKSYHTMKDVQRDSLKDEKVLKIEPLVDITIPGTPVSSRSLTSKINLKTDADLSVPGVPISSKIISNEHKEIENNEKLFVEQKPLEQITKEEILKVVPQERKKLPNFTLQSATPAIPEVIKSPELPPSSKNDFKEKLSRLLSNPPQLNILNLRSRPRSEVIKPVQIESLSPKIEEDKTEIKDSTKTIQNPESTPKTKSPYTLLTETMNRQRKLFDEVLKTIKNKSDDHANDK